LFKLNLLGTSFCVWIEQVFVIYRLIYKDFIHWVLVRSIHNFGLFRVQFIQISLDLHGITNIPTVDRNIFGGFGQK